MFNHLLVANRYRLYRKILFWLVLFCLLFLTLIPSPPEPVTITNIDKAYHFIAFFGFSLIFGLSFRHFNLWLIFCASVLLGLLIEIAQHYIPGRSFSLADFLADATGVLVAIWLLKKLGSRV